MSNQVTIKQDPSVSGIFKASIFNAQGVPVLAPWQEFNVADDMVWDPAKYGDQVTEFYIAKGIGPDPDNSFVAYAVKVHFKKSTENATVTLGIAQVPAINGGSGCNYFTALGENVEVTIVTDGIPVSGTKLPDRCS